MWVYSYHSWYPYSLSEIVDFCFTGALEIDPYNRNPRAPVLIREDPDFRLCVAYSALYDKNVTANDWD